MSADSGGFLSAGIQSYIIETWHKGGARGLVFRSNVDVALGK